jgi:hypothetical protein
VAASAAKTRGCSGEAGRRTPGTSGAAIVAALIVGASKLSTVAS